MKHQAGCVVFEIGAMHALFIPDETPPLAVQQGKTYLGSNMTTSQVFQMNIEWAEYVYSLFFPPIHLLRQARTDKPPFFFSHPSDEIKTQIIYFAAPRITPETLLMPNCTVQSFLCKKKISHCAKN